jgi:hypothetical protein
MRGWSLVALLLVASVARAKGADESDMTGRRELRMLHCPSAVPGAVTRVDDARGGVAVEVSAASEWGQREIRRRATYQQVVAREKRARGSDEHTGSGTGSGRYGYCPGIMMGTTVEASETADGARLVVTAIRRADVLSLRRSARARAARLNAVTANAQTRTTN